MSFAVPDQELHAVPNLEILVDRRKRPVESVKMLVTMPVSLAGLVREKAATINDKAGMSGVVQTAVKHLLVDNDPALLLARQRQEQERDDKLRHLQAALAQVMRQITEITKELNEVQTADLAVTSVGTGVLPTDATSSAQVHGVDATLQLSEQPA